MRNRCLILALAILSLPGSGSLVAQRPPSGSGILRIQTKESGESIAPDSFKALPHVTVTVHNGHSNADETYSGVSLADLLVKQGAPMGKDLHGKALAQYVVATGSDGYKAVLALAEIEPTFHPGKVIVADALDGKPLDKDGPYKLIVTEDKHPARWVRNLVSIELKSAQ